MYFYIIISIFFSLEYAFSIHQNFDGKSDCLTDELYGSFTDEEYNNLIRRRNNVRKLLNENLHRNQQDTLSVKVVFHNVHKIVGEESQHSFCDYQGFGYDYLTENDITICNDRLHKALEILNEQFSPARIKFIVHPQYSTMLEITDPLHDHITGTKIDGIKENYNIPNALNIYLDYCIGEINIENDECNSSVGGFSTYPKDRTNKELGIAIRHFSFPDMSNLGIFVLPHEIGHYFSLQHIEGNWFRANEHPAIEFVNGYDCMYRGDLICDTPAQPGNASKAFYHEIYNDIRFCIYHGYNGNYDPETNLLKIGGYENISLNNDSIPYLADNSWCDETSGIWDEPNGYPDRCWNYTNYDPTGAFFGSRDLPDTCFISDQGIYATKPCHESLFQYLPIATNFLQQTTLAQYCGRRGYHEYDMGEGFTPEQFANIRYSLEYDYTGCNIAEACNFDITSTYLLRLNESSCRFPCAIDGGCLVTDIDYQIDYSQYDCFGNILSGTNYLTPQNIEITQVYPNPFNPITSIHYELNHNVNIQLLIYDIQGRVITTLIDGLQTAGHHSIIWNASKFSSGIYFLKMSAGKITETKELVLVK